MDDQRRSGFDANRLGLMLALKDYPVEPSYYVYELRPDNPQGMRTVLSEWSARTLRSAGVEWVVTQQHPLVFSQVSPSLGQLLDQYADLVISFDPLVPGTPAPPFDPIDAFYTPIGEFSAARYSGPIISIYQLNRN